MLVETRRLRALLLVTALVCPAIAVFAGLRASNWAVERGLNFYIAPLFFAGPLWLRVRLGEAVPRWGARWAMDLSVFALAVLRFVTGHWLPFSGHMLFLTYSGMTTRSGGYRVFAVALALETAWFKFVLWHDPRSFWLGVIGGALAAGVALGVEYGQSFAAT